MGLFSKFEDKAENIIEGGGSSKGGIEPVKIAKRAGKEMQREKMIGVGHEYAPTLYNVLVSSEDEAAMIGYYPTLAGEVETYLSGLASQQNLVFDCQPLVRFIVDDGLKRGKFDVVAENVSPAVVEQLRHEEMVFYGLEEPDPQNFNDEYQDEAQAFDPFAPSDNPHIYEGYDDGYGGGEYGDAGYDAGEQGGGYYGGESDGAGYDGQYGDDVYNEQGAANASQYPSTYKQNESLEDGNAAAAAANVAGGAGGVGAKAAGAAGSAGVAGGAGGVGAKAAGAGAGVASDAAANVAAAGVAAAGAAAAGAAAAAAHKAQQAAQSQQNQQAAAQASQNPQSSQPQQAQPQQAQPKQAQDAAQTVLLGHGSQPLSTARIIERATNKEHTIMGQRATIGRSLQCDIVISDPGVSRLHAEMIREADGWLIRDAKSTNGTQVNDVNIQQSQIFNGDIICVGNTELVFMEA